MESQEQIICHQCPCSRIRTECTEFEKIVDLSDAGIIIYRHSTRVDEAIYLTSDFEINTTNNDVFIIHNTKDAEVNSADIVPALVQNKVDCPRCQHIMDHAQRLLQNVSIVDKQDVIGICDHCKMKGKYWPCVDCTKIVKKFMTSVHIRGDYEETKAHLKAWLKKIQTMLKGVSSDDEKGSKVKSHSQTDLRIDKLRQYSQRVVHVPDVEQMFRPEKYRPTSSKVAPGPKFVYFKVPDEITLIDTEPAKVERTGKDDLVQAEKDTLNKDHVPKMKELELSSDQQIILDQKKSDMIALGPKTVTKAKLPKDLSVEVSKINAIKSDRTKSRLTTKDALKKPKKYHSEEELTTNIADIRKQDSKISKKGFKYFFPKEAKAKRPKSDLTSSVLIKDTQDRLKDQSEARKRKAEENEKKTIAKEQKKRAIMDDQKATPLEDEDDGKKVKASGKKVKDDGKKVKADGKKEKADDEKVKADGKKEKADGEKEISKEPEVKRKAEARKEAVVSRPAKTEHRIPLENKGELKPKNLTRESQTDKILHEHISKEPKTEKVDRVESSTPVKQKSSDKRSGTDEKQHAIPIDATESKKQDAPLKDKDSKTKSEKSDQLSKAKDEKEKDNKTEMDLKDSKTKSEKSDQLSKAKDGKEKDSKTEMDLKDSKTKSEKSDQQSKAKVGKEKDNKTEMDLLKKALASQQAKTEETKQKPQQEEKELKVTESKIKKEVEIVPKVVINRQQVSKKEKEDKETSDKDKTKKGKDEAALLKKIQEKKAKEIDDELKMKKVKEEAEKKALELAAKKAEDAVKALDTGYVPPTSDLITASEESALNRTAPMKDLDIKKIKVRKPSYDDFILRLVKLKKAAAIARKRRALGQPVHLPELMYSPANTVRHKGHSCKDSTCEFCLDSDLELDLHSYLTRREMEEQAGFAEMILGEKIIKKTRKPPMKKEENMAPVLFMSAFDELSNKMQSGTVPKVVFEVEPPPNTTALKSHATAVDQDGSKGVIRYALSDRQFIEKGWTLLPTEKVVRKMNVYRMRPAHPEFDWFERNKNKRLIPYDTGEKFAEFDDNGRGRWFYKNGRLALDYYDAEETNAQQRFVIYSSGEPDERGRSRPVTVLATFDYLGNGVVFDHGGKIRLKYNQTEGVVLDRGIGPVSHWKWHTLNDPPVLQQVMIDTQMSQKDPDIVKLGGSADNKTRPDNEDMLAIEFDNFIKEKSKKSSQKFKPFQIKMKALKINEQFSLRVLDQATVYLIFREASANLKLNIGMLLDHQEIVDTDTAEVGEVSNNVERCPARSDSLAALQNSVTFAQRYERMRTERERRLRPTQPSASADQLTAGTSRPLRPPLLTAPAAAADPSSDCRCKRRKPSTTNLYYDTRFI